MLLTHTDLMKCLTNIGYTIRGNYPNRFVFNHKNENTGIRVWNETLEVNCENGNKCIFCFEKTKIKMLEVTTVNIGTEGCFINLYNFEKQPVSTK